MAGTLTTHPLAPNLPAAERRALWSIRHILRPDPPPCALSPHRHAWGLAADLARVQAGFRHAVERLGLARMAPLRVGLRNSVSLSEHESIVLRYLARLQVGSGDADGSLAPLMSDRRFLPALTEALDELAAILAFGGYWLADPQDFLHHPPSPGPSCGTWPARIPGQTSLHRAFQSDQRSHVSSERSVSPLQKCSSIRFAWRMAPPPYRALPL